MYIKCKFINVIYGIEREREREKEREMIESCTHSYPGHNEMEYVLRAPTAVP